MYFRLRTPTLYYIVRGRLPIVFSLVSTLYRTVTYDELKMESESKKEVLCEYEGVRMYV